MRGVRKEASAAHAKNGLVTSTPAEVVPVVRVLCPSWLAPAVDWERFAVKRRRTASWFFPLGRGKTIAAKIEGGEVERAEGNGYCLTPRWGNRFLADRQLREQIERRVVTFRISSKLERGEERVDPKTKCCDDYGGGVVGRVGVSVSLPERWGAQQDRPPGRARKGSYAVGGCADFLWACRSIRCIRSLVRWGSGRGRGRMLRIGEIGRGAGRWG